ncbi:MAG TPA: fumarate hydratase [Clostridiales bacterium]|nr:fumarate hydratase [Clostridiales bacterium]
MSIRTIFYQDIVDLTAKLCIQANKILPNDLISCLARGAEQETAELPSSIMQDLMANLDAAKELDIPICQDTGMAVVFVELGADVHITGGLLEDAINDGVAKGYEEGFLRKSIVADPLNRVNTGNNTPAVIHLHMTAGDQLKIMVAPKGFGSENMSQLKMFTPAAGVEEIKAYILDVVRQAGSNPCPPMVLGIGIGGDFEYAAYLAKKALCRPVEVRNQNPYYADLEADLLEEINATGIGPQGFGGKTTCLAVNIEYGATHIAGLPVAVNVGCHVTRHATGVL